MATSNEQVSGVERDPGSFRDRESRVLVGTDAVYRLLSERGAEDWSYLASSRLFEDFTADGTLVSTEETSNGVADPEASRVLGQPVRAVLRHERVPFVSYPYEWTFGMLREAALLQLDLQLAALEEGMSLKDATPYNVQWRGSNPVFIDIGSFETLREGEPWAGYRQFCMLFLYPLMLQAYRGIAFQPLARGSIDGIAPTDAARLLRGRDRFRRGVLSHVHLHARMERRYGDRDGAEIKRDLRRASFKAELIKANVTRLRKLVARLNWRAGDTAWTRYREANTYTGEDTARKAAFVRAAVAERRPALVWDMGCNDGAYAKAAVDSGAGYVVAFDLDHATVEALYRTLREAGNTQILPLVLDLADPSPGLGWRGMERRPIEGRGRPDLALVLALIHHLSITANVPLAEILDWLRSLDRAVVLEFPTREDPKVQGLLSGKRQGSNGDYELETFERLLGERFSIRRREPLPSGTRILYHLHPV